MYAQYKTSLYCMYERVHHYRCIQLRSQQLRLRQLLLAITVYSLVRQVGDSANASFEARAVNITRHWHNNFNIVSYTPTLKLALCFHHVLYAGVAVRLHYSL
jgi:hypothetical protein